MKWSCQRQFIIYNIIILIFEIISVFFAVYSPYKLHKSRAFTKNILINWHLNPIVSIAKFKGNCPDNYQHLLLTTDESLCEFDEDRGRNIKRKKINEYNYLLDNFNNSLCGSTLTNFSYLNYLNDTYSSGHQIECEKNCGIIDTINNLLCVKNNEECPLNNFELTYNNSSNINSGVKNHFGVSLNNFNIKNNYYLDINNKIGKNNSKIILGFSILEENNDQNKECSNINGVENRNQNYLNNEKMKNKMKMRVSKETQMNSLNTINFIGWRNDCFLNMTQNPDKVMQFISNYSTIYNNSYNLVYSFIIFAIFVLFIIFIYAPYKDISDTAPYIYVLIINSIFLIISVDKILSNISISWTSLYGNVKEKYPIEFCSDENTNYSFLQIKKTFYSILWYDTFLFFSQIINWLVPFYIVAFIYAKKDEDEQEKKSPILKSC